MYQSGKDKMLHNQSISLKPKSRFVVSNEVHNYVSFVYLSKNVELPPVTRVLPNSTLHHRNTKKGFSTDGPTPSLFPTRSVCTHVDTHAVFTSTLVESPDLKFRALAWQLGFALARNFAFNTALGTGVYHWRGICTGVDTRAVFASTLVETLKVGRDALPSTLEYTRFDTGLGFWHGTRSHWLATGFQYCFQYWHSQTDGLQFKVRQLLLTWHEFIRQLNTVLSPHLNNGLSEISCIKIKTC
ncbi:uncharacterized protein EV154DRAFT_551661 [Mucor mucedo]|uniref:uncharacterized protein n=1 Tax=Mucor mucedo TaxID=29922 RepID=UPI00221F5CAB|nr:uncharacterized protein EV154DRAFT_551661 [Mucor mucedo]KAI7891317.1 hypothetical protein EV154DRAFT_551661 [Mucor mucedo]